MKSLEKIIPLQHPDDESETAYSIEKKTPKEARQLYAKAKANLLDVNHWHDFAGKGSADFQLTDEQGHPVTGILKKGYYFRINIRSTTTGTDKYDWVKVEDIEEGHIDGVSDWTIVKIKPVEQSLPYSGELTHFFSASASSNFFVKRQRHKVTAAIFGRSEKPDAAIKGFWEKFRISIIGILRLIGFNRPQWKQLVKGILRK